MADKSQKVIFENELDVQSQVPLYYQLVVIIKRCINAGILLPGDLLPSELELCEKFAISRSTVRQAFSALESEGLVLRQRGKGTFVSKPKLRRSLNNLYSFSAEMRGLGLSPESRILDFETILPTPDLVGRLRIASDEPVFKIVRLRYADAEPLMIETVFIPRKICPELSEELLASHSLYQTIREKSGMKVTHAVESYEATIMDKNEAELLHAKPGSCAFFVQRLSENDAGEIFELALILVRGDRCRYEVELKPDNVSILRRFDNKETVDL